MVSVPNTRVWSDLLKGYQKKKKYLESCDSRSKRQRKPNGLGLEKKKLKTPEKSDGWGKSMRLIHIIIFIHMNPLLILTVAKNKEHLK